MKTSAPLSGLARLTWSRPGLGSCRGDSAKIGIVQLCLNRNIKNYLENDIKLDHN